MKSRFSLFKPISEIVGLYRAIFISGINVIELTQRQSKNDKW